MTSGAAPAPTAGALPAGPPESPAFVDPADLAERHAPLLDHRMTGRGGELVEPRVVRRQAHVPHGAPELVVGEELLVVRAAVDQGVHERVAVVGQVVDGVAGALQG